MAGGVPVLLRVERMMPVFTHTRGGPIEPNSLLPHWYAAQRACGNRVRGLYSTKDTFVTTALEAGVTIAWLETQTGVNYLTLRRHYGRWMPSDVGRELERFAALDPGLLAEFTPPVVTGNKRDREQRRETPPIPRISRCERGDLNPHGCLVHRILNPARLPIPPLSRGFGHSRKAASAQVFRVEHQNGADRRDSPVCPSGVPQLPRPHADAERTG